MIFRGRKGAALGLGLFLGLASPLQAQAPYIPDVTEAREKQWRQFVAEAQAAYAAGDASGVNSSRMALAIAENLFGPDDPRTLVSANDLALQLEATGRVRESEGLLRRVFESARRTRGEDDPTTQLALENLIDFYIARKRYDMAAPLADYALSSFRRTTGKESQRSQRMAKLIASLPKAESGRVEASEEKKVGQSLPNTVENTVEKTTTKNSAQQ
ncbi:tetratricopeptide repeat protein [Sphingobium bisphenolivorans]|uniref:tetratricopeptide repeat protein n=1 Tax=Sphingobium bisphenolivorans TaxID=1335760 RepID=UPI00039BEB30|nr:tetratricopeptide repeat protein [Sphingobium bisphenolivorans]